MFDTMFNAQMFLAQVGKKVEQGQGEYAQAWALVGVLMFFGLLVVLIPRPRLVDIPENDKKNREKHHGGKGHSGKVIPGSRAGGGTSFQSALSQQKK